jgi:hypothetical protein
MAAGSTCSKLSSTTNSRRPDSASSTRSSAGRPTNVQQPKCPRDRAGHQIGVANRGEVDQHDAVWEVVAVFAACGGVGQAGGRFQGQARFTYPCRTSERQQAGAPRDQ